MCLETAGTSFPVMANSASSSEELKQKLWTKDSLGDSPWTGLWPVTIWLYVWNQTFINLNLLKCHDTDYVIPPLFMRLLSNLQDPCLILLSALSLLFHREKWVGLFPRVLLKPLLIDGCMLISCHVNWSYIKHGLIKSSWNKKITSATQNYFFCDHWTSYPTLLADSISITVNVKLRKREKRETSTLFNFQPGANTLLTARQNNQGPKAN